MRVHPIPVLPAATGDMDRDHPIECDMVDRSNRIEVVIERVAVQIMQIEVSLVQMKRRPDRQLHAVHDDRQRAADCTSSFEPVAYEFHYQCITVPPRPAQDLRGYLYKIEQL